MGTIPFPDSMEQTMRSLMAAKQANGYDAANPKDAKIMAEEAANTVNTYLKVYGPEQAAQVLTEELQSIRRAKKALSDGAPEAFSGDGLDVGYYFSDDKSPTGSALMGPGSPTFNPNKAQLNQTIKEHVYLAALQSLIGN